MRERRTETARRIEQTRDKIEQIVASTNDPSHKVFGLVALSFTDLFSDITDKLQDVSEVQTVQADTLNVQTHALKSHEDAESLMLSKLKGAIWAFTIVGGGLGALLVWVALGLVADVRANTEDIRDLSKAVAVNSEKLRVISDRQRPAP